MSIRDTLAQRPLQKTSTPLFTGFESLDGARPNQTQPAHELLLRDVIQTQARFLNFFGDRFNSQDLYQRSKYPSWLTPPEGFNAAVPQLWAHLADADGTVLWHREFSGTLQSKVAETQVGHRLNLELTALSEVFNTPVDLTFSLGSQRPIRNGLQFQIHRNNQLVQAHNLEPGKTSWRFEVSALQPGEALAVCVVVMHDAPAAPAGYALTLQTVVHPPGTHPAPSVLSRLKAWLRRATMRTPQGT